MAVEDADDLGKLEPSMLAIMLEAWLRHMVLVLTGSSGLFVLLRVADTLLISSIMVVRSEPISCRRFETFSACL